jgi:hypothetical protein
MVRQSDQGADSGALVHLAAKIERCPMGCVARLALLLLPVIVLSCNESPTRSRLDGRATEGGASGERGSLRDGAPGERALVDLRRDQPPRTDGQPAAPGLAARYPGDKGLDSDPAVVFVESFEEGSVSAVTARYEDFKNAAGMSLVPDIPAKSSGKASLKLNAGGGTDATDLYKKLATGYDELYLRYYVKYASGVTWHHTGVWLSGYNPPLDWPSPQAGLRPSGDDRFSVSVEPMGAGSSPGPRLDFYNYWMKMHSWMDQPSGDGAYWGNTLVHQSGFRVTNDAWMCIEIHVKLNPSPSSAAGAELTVWKDDALVQSFTDSAPLGYWIKDKFCPVGADSSECTDYPPPGGTPMIPLDLQFRSTTDLKLNSVWPQNYVTEGPAGAVYYDDLVVATARIGCIQ